MAFVFREKPKRVNVVASSTDSNVGPGSYNAVSSRPLCRSNSSPARFNSSPAAAACQCWTMEKTITHAHAAAHN
jgi:hypothetical protein